MSGEPWKGGLLRAAVATASCYVCNASLLIITSCQRSRANLGRYMINRRSEVSEIRTSTDGPFIA